MTFTQTPATRIQSAEEIAFYAKLQVGNTCNGTRYQAIGCEVIDTLLNRRLSVQPSHAAAISQAASMNKSR